MHRCIANRTENCCIRVIYVTMTMWWWTGNVNPTYGPWRQSSPFQRLQSQITSDIWIGWCGRRDLRQPIYMQETSRMKSLKCQLHTKYSSNMLPFGRSRRNIWCSIMYSSFQHSRIDVSLELFSLSSYIYICIMPIFGRPAGERHDSYEIIFLANTFKVE